MSQSSPSPFPVSVAGPRRRIETIDVIRGVALCGLVPMNILEFAFLKDHYLTPQAIDPSLHWAWYALSIFGLGKFVTLFSMLFGAGVLLATESADQRGEPITGRYLRRLEILFGFGMIHAYLIWYGDILVSYALIGILVYFCRNFSAKWHAAIGAIFFLGWALLVFALGGVLSALDLDWESIVEESSDEEFDKWVEESAAGGFFAQIPARAMFAIFTQLLGIPFVLFWLSGGMMFLGMALFRTGFFSGEWSRRRYVLMAICGGLAGSGLGALAHFATASSSWDIPTFILWAPVNLIATPLLSLCYASIIGLLSMSESLRSGWFWKTFRNFGKLALTNYLSQSVIMGLIFYGHGLGLKGDLSFGSVMLIVPVIWIVQAILSNLWLSYFSFGPCEWLWRCLTYGRRMPIIKG